MCIRDRDTDTKMSGADQDEFLKKFEDELENETYDEYLSNFEKEYGSGIASEEIMFLAIHIKRVCMAG